MEIVKCIHFRPPKHDKKDVVGQYIVSTLGYVPARDKIKAMTIAGANLAIARTENYMFPAGNWSEENEELYDPTTHKSFDFFAAVELADKSLENLKAYRDKLTKEQAETIDKRREELEEFSKLREKVELAEANNEVKKPENE